tara:strand:- start:1058 stop:1282 length:225 start_codon:yes stop_codon:yes gene_type:complete
MINVKQLIEDLGGIKAVENGCEVHRTTVHNWVRYNRVNDKLMHMTFDKGLNIKDYWNGETAVTRTQEAGEGSCS